MMHGVCPGRDRVFRVVPPCFPEIKVSGQLCVVHGRGAQAVREEVRSASQGLRYADQEWSGRERGK